MGATAGIGSVAFKSELLLRSLVLPLPQLLFTYEVERRPVGGGDAAGRARPECRAGITEHATRGPYSGGRGVFWSTMIFSRSGASGSDYWQ
jgi:hypothetical protein